MQRLKKNLTCHWVFHQHGDGDSDSDCDSEPEVDGAQTEHGAKRQRICITLTRSAIFSKKGFALPFTHFLWGWVGISSRYFSTSHPTSRVTRHTPLFFYLLLNSVRHRQNVETETKSGDEEANVEESKK